MSELSGRGHFLEGRDALIRLVPGGGAAGINVGAGGNLIRIIHAGGADGDHVRPQRIPAHNCRPAIRAKAAADDIAAIGRPVIEF